MNRRAAFTLIELLVVLLVITVIAAMLIVGLSAVYSGQQGRQTEARLAILETMLENLRMSGGGNTGGGFGGGTNLQVVSSDQSVMWAMRNSTGPGVDWEGGGGLDFIVRGLGGGTNSLGDDNVASRTQRLMAQMLAVPANAAIVADQPSDFLRTNFTWASAGARDTDGGGGVGQRSGLAMTLTEPESFNGINGRLTVGLPQDGWGSTILLVPDSGLAVARMNADGTHNSGNGLRPAMNVWTTNVTTQDFLGSPVNGPRARLIARDNGPFFVSGGSDGASQFGMLTHGDNLYSRPVVFYDNEPRWDTDASWAQARRDAGFERRSE